MQEFIEIGNEMAGEAGEIIRQYFRQPFDIENKDDKTPVTIADRAVEQRLREMVEKVRPDDGIMGEEFGPKESKSGLTWVFDPIDGTKSFIVGRPTFGTLIALWDGDTPLMGIIDQPILKECWIGVKDQPTTFNGKEVRTRPCAHLKDAVSACTSPRQIEDLWPSLYDKTQTIVWGGDCYSYGLMANGWLDLIIEGGLGTYDFAAIPPIVEGAGGLMCDWDGKPLTLNSDGMTVAMGDPALKEDVLGLINAQRT